MEVAVHLFDFDDVFGACLRLPLDIASMLLSLLAKRSFVA